jgi:intraflagellar transport protein 80
VLLYVTLCDQCGWLCVLQAGLVYKAIKLHVRLHNWQRALGLARKHQQHVDTVLMHRRRWV